MNYKPTKSGGRIAQGKTAFGNYFVEWDANNKLIRETSDIKDTETPKPQGLGDTVKKTTDALGIKQCPKCPKRQAKLNKWFPYKFRWINKIVRIWNCIRN